MNRLADWAQRTALRRRRPATQVHCQGPYVNDHTLVDADGAAHPPPRRRRRWFRSRLPGETTSEYWIDVAHVQIRAHRAKLFGVIALLVGALALLLLVDALASRSERAELGAAVHAARAAYAPRVAERLALYTPRAPLRAAGEQLEYAQLRGERPLPDGDNLELVMQAARALLDDEPCACAPLFGARASYLAVRRASGNGTLHLFNVRDEARAVFDDAARIGELGTLSLVEHTHDALFDWPGHDAVRPLRVVRRDALPLRVTALSGVERALTLRGRVAHCACACVDLINGVTLWERALRQQPLLEASEDAALAHAARIQKLLAGVD